MSFNRLVSLLLILNSCFTNEDVKKQIWKNFVKIFVKYLRSFDLRSSKVVVSLMDQQRSEVVTRNFANILGTPFLQNTSGRLLLYFTFSVQVLLEAVAQMRSVWKDRKIHKSLRKTHEPESLFSIKLQDLSLQLYWKRDSCTSVFLWILQKNLRTTFLEYFGGTVSLFISNEKFLTYHCFCMC